MSCLYILFYGKIYYRSPVPILDGMSEKMFEFKSPMGLIVSLQFIHRQCLSLKGIIRHEKKLIPAASFAHLRGAFIDTLLLTESKLVN